MRRLLFAGALVIACASTAVAQTWQEVWPGYDAATSAAQAPAGWEDCSGYPERRNFLEAQWHDAASGNLDEARHLHIGACIPEQVSGIFQIDWRIVTFHWSDATFLGIRKNPIRTGDGIVKLMPAPYSARLPGSVRVPLTEHMHKLWLPVRYDTRKMLTDGAKLMECDVDIQRKDGVHHLVRIQIPLTFVNGEGRSVVNSGAGYYAVESWMTKVVDGVEVSPFGYLRGELFNFLSGTTYKPRRFESQSETAYYWRAKSNKAARTITAMAVVDPDLHQHPPFYGTVVLPDTKAPAASTIFSVFPTLHAGNRLMFRSADQTPGLPDGAGASLFILTIGKDGQ